MAINNTRTGPLDWTKVLTNEARVNDVILASELASKYNLPVASVQKALLRLKDRGLVSRVRFRTISRNLYWGFVEKQTRYATYLIAEPEKALLDWVYLSLQVGIRPSLDEIEFKSVRKKKLAEYASKFPASVRNVMTHSLAFEHFTA